MYNLICTHAHTQKIDLFLYFSRKVETITMSELINFLDEFKDGKEEQHKIFTEKPYARELSEGSLNPKALTISCLEKAIETAVYLGMNTDILVEELIWKSGKSKRKSRRYFGDKWNLHKGDTEYFLKEKIHSQLLHLELKSRFQGTFFSEKISARFRCISLVRCAMYGNLRLMKFARKDFHVFSEVCMIIAERGDLEMLKYVNECECEKTHGVCTVLAKKGYLECLKYAHTHGWPWNAETCAGAANLQCLQYAHENGCAWDARTCSNAAKYGRLDCLRYAHENDCDWNADVYRNAAAGGYLEIIKYAHERKCIHTRGECKLAAANGHLDCLQYLHEAKASWGSTCELAALGGHLDCLQYARSHGCRWNEKTCTAAAAGGHLKCLRYAREAGCKWNEDTFTSAAKNGNLECIQYLNRGGCPFDTQKVCCTLISQGHLEGLRYLTDRYYVWNKQLAIHTAIQHRHIPIVKFMIELGAALSPILYAEAIVTRDLETVKILHEAKCPMNSSLSIIAAEVQCLEILKFLISHGCGWDSQVTSRAALYGNLKILEYAHTHGCAWANDVCENAGINGNLRCLKYAHKNGCKWDANTMVKIVQHSDDLNDAVMYLTEHKCPHDYRACAVAAQHESVSLLKFLHTSGCEWTESTCIIAARNGRLENLKYAHSHGCPAGFSTYRAACNEACRSYLRSVGVDFSMCGNMLLSTCTDIFPSGDLSKILFEGV